MMSRLPLVELTDEPDALSVWSCAVAIYLAGVSVGLLPYSTELIVAAILVVAVASIGFSIASVAHERWSVAAVYLIAVVPPLTIIYLTLRQRAEPRVLPIPRQEPWIYDVGVASSVVLFSCVIFCILYLNRKYVEKQEQQLKRQRQQLRLDSPQRRRASREPRIIRRQRLPNRASGTK
jgi:hypothetical protein